MAYAAVTSLQKTIDELLCSRRLYLPHPSPIIIELVYDELKSLQEVLQRLDATSKGSSRKNVNALDAEIKDAVWKFEDLIESHVYPQILVQSDSDQTLKVNLEEIREDIYRFERTLQLKQEAYVSELYNMMPEEDEETASGTATQTADSGEKKFKMVGPSSDILLATIRSRLDFSRPVDVVPVVGMAGIGKTTVAREFFDDPLLLSEFEIECRAWVSVGRKPRIPIIKREILNQLDRASSRDREIRERDVEHLLKGMLKAKRCLVVLDDVWDTLVWDELGILFPDHGRGRNLVLLTTRLGYVGDEADKSWSKMRCEVELLYKEQSWDLLRRRVFGEEEEDCPWEFIKSGQKIAEKCDGLPLMIVTVANLLSEAEMTAEFWEEVAESKKNHPIFMAAYDQLYEVLLPSYEYLPQHLKPCFLHMGVFPQRGEIRRSKLMCLWVVEGFLDPTELNSFHIYMSELIDHSVVIICKRGSMSDDVKTCRLHSCFWHLCSREATNSNFFCILSSRDDGFQELRMRGQRRLSFHKNILFAMKDVLDSIEEACASSSRSLLCYGPHNPYPVPFCFGLRLLKLLDLLRLRFYEFPVQVLKLVYLRFLGITCNNAIPPGISKLWDLHILIIKRYKRIRFSGKTPYLPVEIWNMRELERIDIMGWNLPNPPSDYGVSSSLERLITLIGVGAETCTPEVLERLSNLTKLGILIESHPNGDDMKVALDCLNNIHVSRKLTSLICVVLNPILTVVSPPVSMFPSSLTKLFLSGLGYPWEFMSIIGSLPNLLVLKLRCYAFRGPEWIVRYGEFRVLKYLLVEATDLVHFEVEDKGLFRLRMLCLHDCYKLKHILWEPDLCYPVSIAMFDCSPSAETFAKELRSRYESHPQTRYHIDVHSSWEDDGNIK